MLVRSLTEEILRHHVKHRRPGGRFPTILGEELVAPIQQVVDIPHHDRLLVGAKPEPGNGVRIKGIVLVDLEFLREFSVNIRRFVISEGLVPPVPCGVRCSVGSWRRNRVVDGVIPFLRLTETLIAVQPVRNEERDMEEDLLVVDGVMDEAV